MLALVACGTSTRPLVAPGPTDIALPFGVATTSPPAPTIPPTPTPRRTTATPTHRPTLHSTRPPVAKPKATRTRTTLLVERLHGVGNAHQVVSVVANGYGSSSATLQAFTKTASGWKRSFGPWSAHIGRHGFAPPGDKREGDLRTPSGSYGFSFMFGVRANPGVRYEYRRVTGDWHVWADDPGTARYNLWSDTRTQDAGPSPEPMNNVPAYNYSAVIAYNTARTSGLGSAIFLHVSTGGGTAGCVSLPTGELLDVLRWLDPAKAPRIIMGTEAYVT
jgi:L,D-peptidoglycan transpeptidase YkuD (ErfK/YbiS/YcfS/YnhG family)